MQGVKIFATVVAIAFALMATAKISSASPAQGENPDPNRPWGEFAFEGLGDTLVCINCTPSSGNNSFFLGEAPWTFDGPGFLIVQDAFFRGDRFEVFDDETSLGLTSIPVIDDENLGPGCGSNPVFCFGDPGASRRIFTLGDGPHEFTIRVVQAPFGSGAAYLCIDTGRGECGVTIRDVPEPTSMLLLGLGLAGAFYWIKRPRLSEVLLLIPRIRRKR